MVPMGSMGDALWSREAWRFQGQRPMTVTRRQIPATCSAELPLFLAPNFMRSSPPSHPYHSYRYGKLEKEGRLPVAILHHHGPITS
jgi:hypothetical protein